MDVIAAIVLGAVQGLTEFLPVSSSGHLVLLQKIFGISEPTMLFDIMLHIGTLAAVFAVLWKDVLAILKKIVQPLTAYLIIATVPAVIFALVLKKHIEAAFESGRFLGFAFLATAALLASAELLSRRARRASDAAGNADDAGGKTANTINWLDALVIGFLQAVAVIPGVSRSGATLSGALFRRLDRDFAARFSFILSIPAILGALVLELAKFAKGGGASVGGGIGMAAIVAGTASAAVTGFFAVRLMLKIVREKSLWGFAIYTGALGLLVLIDQFGTRLVLK
jgi:undecaprenyl-diphosphatase